MITHARSILIFLSVLFFLTSCAPQAALVKTDKEIVGLRADTKAAKEQLRDMQQRLKKIEADVGGTVNLQKSIADYGAQFDQLTTDIQLVQGKLEENNFRISELAQKLDDQSFKTAELTARIEELEKALKDDEARKARIPEPSDLYRQAKNDYDAGNYNLAIAGFGKYIAEFPKASKVDNARYWIGECYYSKKQYEKSRESFLKVLTDHPKSDKAPGARLKIGFSYFNEKNYTRARRHLNAVIRDYPNSTEAKIARDKLKKISKKTGKKK